MLRYRHRRTSDGQGGRPLRLAGGRSRLRREGELRGGSPGRVHQSDPARPVDQGEHGLRGTGVEEYSTFIEVKNILLSIL